MGHWSSAMKAIKNADVVVLVMDARMPELSRNKDLEEKLETTGKKIFLVFNKIDLISKESLTKLKKENPVAFFTSSGKETNVGKLRTALQIEGKREGVKLEVGIVGYPNVGKSALINSLSRSAKTKVSSKAGTTLGLQWASSAQFKLLDSPGVIPYEDDEIKLGILGAKNPEKLKNIEPVALNVIEIFLKNNSERLEELYKFKIKDKDSYEILLQIGEAKKLLKKGGVVDENRTSLIIIKDWQTGKLRI